MDEELGEVFEEEMEEFDPDRAVKGIFYSVLIKYNLDNPAVKRKKIRQEMIESDAFSTYVGANQFSTKTAEGIKKMYKGAHLFEVEPTEFDDYYTLYVMDKQERFIAKIGVVAEDYRDKTIH